MTSGVMRMGASRAVETKQCRLQGTALPRRAHAPMRAVRQAATSSFAGAGKNSRATARADSLVLRAAAEEVNSTKVAAVSVVSTDEPTSLELEPLLDGNDGGASGGGSGDGGGDGEGSGDGGMDPRITTVLVAAGRTVESFPADFAAALSSGKVTVEILQRYLKMEKNFFLKFFWGIQGIRERMLADPSFPVKLAIECGIGIFTKCTAEKAKREEQFWNEIDFVAANVLMAIIADFMLTWMPAPTLSYAGRAAASNRLFTRVFAHCPDNAFQKVRVGAMAFTPVQRAGAVARNGLKLLAVGFGASMLGVGMTNAISSVRTAMDPEWHAPNGPQDLVKTSAAYGVYMGVSSNLRYQILAGIIEERGIESIFAGKPGLCHALSFFVRTANTYFGSLLWVDFVRLCGMQKAHTAEETS